MIGLIMPKIDNTTAHIRYIIIVPGSLNIRDTIVEHKKRIIANNAQRIK
jgi:hypothetical protein